MSKIIIHNVGTGEIVERDMTDEEISQLELDNIRIEKELKLKKEAQIAKIALLDKLGITEEEAKILLS